MDPQAIFEQMIDAYKRADSYLDTGYTTYSLGGENDRGPRRSFTTLFRRPRLLRSEQRLEGWSPLDMVFWCDGRAAYQNISLQGTVRLRNLWMTILGSWGELYPIMYDPGKVALTLLMPELEISMLTAMADIEYLGVARIRDEECYHLRTVGTTVLGPTDKHLWISTKRFILCKARSTDVHDLSRYEVYSQKLVDEETDPVVKEFVIEQHRPGMEAQHRRWKLERFPELAARKDSRFASEFQPRVAISETIYTQVQLNIDIPQQAFSLSGRRHSRL
jgi:hypothetical protein